MTAKFNTPSICTKLLDGFGPTKKKNFLITTHYPKFYSSKVSREKLSRILQIDFWLY